MRQVIAGTLLVIYLFSTTELHQFLKLPALVSHFAEHHQENPKLSLWQFLCIHYAHGDVMDADRDKDLKLPFKSFDNCNNTNLISLLPELKFSLVEFFSPETTIELPNYYSSFLGASYLDSIWQPPKQV